MRTCGRSLGFVQAALGGQQFHQCNIARGVAGLGVAVAGSCRIQGHGTAIQRVQPAVVIAQRSLGVAQRRQHGLLIGQRSLLLAAASGETRAAAATRTGTSAEAMKKHLATIVSGTVPAENMAQLQTGLLVSGREWIDYVSWCGGMPMYPIRVYPDEAWFAAIVAAAEAVEVAIRDLSSTYNDRVAGLPMTERIDYEMEMVI